MRPDLVTLAKGLANGLPIGCLLVADDAAGAFVPGDHGSTFGGNPVVCAAALAVVRARSTTTLLASVRANGAAAAAGLAGAAARRRGARRAACSSARSSTRRPRPVVDAALDAGLVCLTSGANVLRLAPPLVVGAARCRPCPRDPHGGA